MVVDGPLGKLWNDGAPSVIDVQHSRVFQQAAEALQDRGQQRPTDVRDCEPDCVLSPVLYFVYAGPGSKNVQLTNKILE